MNKRVELPLVEPVYSTYHYQGISSAIADNHQSVKNWHLNHCGNLFCSRKFLSGYTTPEITVSKTYWSMNPLIEKITIPVRFSKRYLNAMIHEMLDQGYYVAFGDVDDYYIPGKSWYKEKHAKHDGLICGYDDTEKTYCIYAYDSNWVYQKFWTPQRAFIKSCSAIWNKGEMPSISALKAREEIVEFSLEEAYWRIREYLHSDHWLFPFDGEGEVKGIFVQEYILLYLKKLMDGDIPYERMDRRVFRVIWEHKKNMLDRILAFEEAYQLGDLYSTQYARIVKQADTMRMLYASHHMRRRDSVLSHIYDMLSMLSASERVLLQSFVETLERKRK